MFDTRLKKILVAAGVAVVLAIGGAAIAGAVGGGDDEDDAAITGSALDKGSAAALDHTGGGRVTDTEVGDEESYYEVEVTLSGGNQVDVQLDRDFKVVGQEGDSENEEGGNDD